MSKKTMTCLLLLGLLLSALPVLAAPPAQDTGDGGTPPDALQALTAGPGEKAEKILAAQEQEVEASLRQVASCGLADREDESPLGAGLPLLKLRGESVSCTRFECRSPCIDSCQAAGCFALCADPVKCRCECLCL